MGKKHKKRRPEVHAHGPRLAEPEGKTVWYRQCVLRDGNTRTTTWLKERRIREGVQVTLKNSEDPDRLWTVESMGMKRDEKWVQNKRKAYDRWRDHTDV